MSVPEYTADQLEAGIANALAAQDVQAVHDILLVLTRVDPKRAAVVLDTINVGIEISRRRDGRAHQDR